MRTPTPIILDGRTGEGGGQLVRLACALAAVTSQPVRIDNVRGNRPGRAGGRGGGLKAQHVSAVQWLSEVTNAEVEGLAVGSKTLEFKPSLLPTALEDRKIKIVAGSKVASTLLIFQAVFPYLLFASNENEDPIELEIHGGTNCSFSPSFEYLDQVLLPTLQDRYGITVQRKLGARAWTLGPPERGCIWVKFQPISPGQKLKLLRPWGEQYDPKDFDIEHIDVSILVPQEVLGPLEKALTHLLAEAFPGTIVNFVLLEASSHPARMYALAVARSATGLRWGQDYLYDQKYKDKKPAVLAANIAKKVANGLYAQAVTRGTVVDEYLEDQLVVFQALAEGRTQFPTKEMGDENGDNKSHHIGNTEDWADEVVDLPIEGELRKDKTDGPIGDGSTHTTTARWVASEILPDLKWFNKGFICDGVGISFDT
ncbi:RNA 3'-terminal phosphate cyclase [Xylariaceae sp. FL1019]|nr:RNA 3'-terminal phosphate cyclase [Xylariaceae sp. FL1019]